MSSESWWIDLDEIEKSQLQALWGKSDAGGFMNLLIQHLFDTAAVAEVMWKSFLPASLKARLDEIAGDGGGQALFAWVCGVHDIGKATPMFQSLRPDLAAAVADVGLPFQLRSGDKGWRHDRAGASHLSSNQSTIFGLDEPSGFNWIWPLIGGHHGRFPDLNEIGLKGKADRKRKQGISDDWVNIRNRLLEIVAIATGHASLQQIKPKATPTRGEQLALAGLIVMADWIASSVQLPGVSQLDQVSMEGARRRATIAWRALTLRGGWSALSQPPADIYRARFSQEAREVQRMARSIANEMAQPGLMVVEAPMGEGKTNLALAVAEIWSHKFGNSGVAFAMPTQATCDPIFVQLQAWLSQLGDNLPVALLHGRRLVNQGWNELLEQSRPAQSAELDEFDLEDDYGITQGTCEDCNGDLKGVQPAAEWFLGRYRGLLSPNLVATIDQLLFAATRTKFVSLRFSGLVGKVVVIDEVHAADAYMTEFLDELLTWLASARVPVILLSATLAESQRSELVSAYATGLSGRRHAKTITQVGYPQITVVQPSVDPELDTTPNVSVSQCQPSRPTQQLAVRTIEGSDAAADAKVVAEIKATVGMHGVALVIRNTVQRAQALYEQLVEHFGADVVLLHSRFIASHRDSDTQQVLDQIGARPDKRPKRLVVVATQVAEQSFDVDADVLFTDLAPIDLILQRCGRLHRHQRNRPSTLSQPVVVVTAMPATNNDTPELDRGSVAIYGEHHLLAAATAVFEGTNSGWSLPTDIPRLIDESYRDLPLIRAEWQERAAASAAEAKRELNKRISKAKSFRLGKTGFESEPTLAGLHDHANTRSDAETWVRVRDGDHDALEVVLCRFSEDGYYTIDGHWLGVNGEIATSDPSKAVGGLIRIPTMKRQGRNLDSEILNRSVLPGAWVNHPWLGKTPVLALNEQNSAQLGPFHISYDRLRGLQVHFA